MADEIKVLLAEDDEHIAKLISFKLKKEGFSVNWAVDGQRALASVLSDQWEIIILDVMMPHLTGWQVLQSLRSAQVKTPVLMLTAKGEESDIDRAKELGATHFLKKPFDPTELVRVLRQMIPDPEMVHMTEEFIASFHERLAALDFCLKLIYAHPISEPFTDKIANDLHLISHNLAGVAENYGFTNLGRLAARVENELLQAIGCPMGSVAVTNVIRSAKELERTLRLARETTSFEESPASEATP
jgi:CheY-like chemotaxis protein/HPt (histidine-containing phosphotransfer) domain-containing protein